MQSSKQTENKTTVSNKFFMSVTPVGNAHDLGQYLDMYQHDKKNAKGYKTTPEFYNGMPFYFPLEVILVELKDGKIEQTSQLYAAELEGQEDLNSLHQFIRLCEDQSWLIRQQENTIRDLQEQLADYEQELYEKDLHIQGGLN
jgi:hypothetical protein